MTTRRNNVTTYLNEWRDGSWYLRKPEDLAYRVAEEVVAYVDLPDSTANLANYSETVDEMVEDGTIKVTDHGDGMVTIEI